MKRVRAWLTWSPFARGTWEHLACYLLIMLVTYTVVQALFGQLSVSSWLGGLTGVVIAGVILGVPIYRRSNRPTVD